MASPHAEGVGLRIDQLPCDHKDIKTSGEHPHIATYLVSLKNTSGTAIGHVKAQVLDRAAMERIGPGQMW